MSPKELEAKLRELAPLVSWQVVEEKTGPTYDDLGPSLYEISAQLVAGPSPEVREILRAKKSIDPASLALPDSDRYILYLTHEMAFAMLKLIIAREV